MDAFDVWQKAKGYQPTVFIDGEEVVLDHDDVDHDDDLTPADTRV